MTFVCLWRPDASTGAAIADASADASTDTPAHATADLAGLTASLLRIAPRVRVEPSGLIWADGRGLDTSRLARVLLNALPRAGTGTAIAEPRAGVAATPIAAEVAAKHGDRPVTEVPVGRDRAFLAPFPIAVLSPPPELIPLLEGTGLDCCDDLARLEQAAVEVRFGSAGVALWRLARADDRRRLFEPVPPSLPHASLEWTDFVLHDTGRLLFIANRLVGTVCAALRERGEGASSFTLAVTLNGGGTIERSFLPARMGADPRAWMRLLRQGLEQLQAEERQRLRRAGGVAGLALRVDAVRPAEMAQGDLLDRGFASAGAAAEALATVLERDAVVVTPHNSRHPFLRRRTRWTEEPASLVWARPRLGSGDLEPTLALYLLPEPEPVETETLDRHGFAVPIRYRVRDRVGEGGRHGGHDRDRAVWHDLVTASGPDCLSGGQWTETYAYEVYCCVRADGGLVQLARDVQQDRWEWHGVWR